MAARKRPAWGKIAFVVTSVAAHLGAAWWLLQLRPPPRPIEVFIARGERLQQPHHLPQRPSALPSGRGTAGPRRAAPAPRAKRAPWPTAVPDAPMPVASPVEAEELAQEDLPEVQLDTGEGWGAGGPGGAGTSSGIIGGAGSDDGDARGEPPVPPWLRKAVIAKIQRTVSSEPYPMMAELRGWSGTVRVGFTIRTDGSIEDLRLVETSGHGSLDDAALDAVRHSAPFERPPEPQPIILPMRYVLPK